MKLEPAYATSIGLSDYRRGMHIRRRKAQYVTLILLFLLLVLAATAVMLGNTFYGLDVVMRVIMGEEVKGATFAIMTLRLPRMLAGLLAGIAFGMAGSTFQTMLRNPLASPDIIGITSGASVAAVFAILVLRWSGAYVSLLAILSGLMVALLIYVLSRGGSFSGGRLILIGIGLQAMLSAIIQYLLLQASQYDVPGAMRWLSGSLNGKQMDELGGLVIVVGIAGLFLVGGARALQILELGDPTAIALGMRTDLVRLMLVVAAVLLIAFATAVTGPIAFIGFLSGPIARRMTCNDGASVLCAGLVGGILVLGGDLIGQYALPVTLPVGVITGVVGAPYLLLLLIRLNRRGGAA